MLILKSSCSKGTEHNKDGVLERRHSMSQHMGFGSPRGVEGR